MISPYEIFLDARIALCNSEEWISELPYPQTIHLAHALLDRADMHLGIRSIDGYCAKKSITTELSEAISC